MCVRGGGGDGCRRETMRGWAAWCAREGCSFWFYGACINANLLLRCCTIVSSFLPNERLITGPRAVHGCIIVFRQVDPPAAAALIVIGGLHEGWTVRSAINRIQKRFLCVVVLKKKLKNQLLLDEPEATKQSMILLAQKDGRVHHLEPRRTRNRASVWCTHADLDPCAMLVFI